MQVVSLLKKSVGETQKRRAVKRRVLFLRGTITDFLLRTFSSLTFIMKKAFTPDVAQKREHHGG